MNNLIVNADDFGKSKEINEAIMAAMDLNLCLDTTILVNFDDSAQAVQLAKEKGRINNIGIHMNLSEGIPLTNKIKKESRFCNAEGIFHYKKSNRIFHLTKSERNAVLEELNCQINVCRNYGVPISHADSHNHVHEEPGMLVLMLQLLKNQKIPFLRLANNLEDNGSVNNFYRRFYNSVLSFKKYQGSAYFGSIRDYWNSSAHKSGTTVEIMIHPGKIVENQIIDFYTGENLSIELPRLLEKNRLISYYSR
jgi:chitin disaccharide deacetylase